MSTGQTDGRRRNGAQKLGERSGLETKEGTKRVGLKSRQAAGPDGPDAGVAAAALKKH